MESDVKPSRRPTVTAAEKAQAREVSLRRIAALFAPYRRSVAGVTALIVVSSVVAMASPFLLRAVIDDSLPRQDLTLLALVGIVAVLYVAATWAAGKLARLPAREQPHRYAHTLVPIALGYTVAHYFSLLVMDGQTTWILLSNPFGTAGTDVFGTYDNRIDYGVVSTDVIALVQVGAVVAVQVGEDAVLVLQAALAVDGRRVLDGRHAALLLSILGRSRLLRRGGGECADGGLVEGGAGGGGGAKCGLCRGGQHFGGSQCGCVSDV